MSTIEVKGASEHNLKAVDVTIERQKITVVTGVSGSGKSSLAFDTVLAEAQRRFFYTLSHYSRQFLDLTARPAVRSVTGLSPAISLAQNETMPSRRATVGTLTDISELFGVMLARFGEQRCPEHGLATSAATVEALVDRLLAAATGEGAAILVPVAESKKGVFRKELEAYAAKGYLRAWIDGALVPLVPVPPLAREEKHTIKVVVDLVKVVPEGRARLTRAIETAIQLGAGFAEWRPATATALDMRKGRGGALSTKGGCPVCGYTWERLDSRHFSANSLGKCDRCAGFGVLAPALADDEEAEDDDAASGEELERSGMQSRCPDCDGTGLSPRMDGVVLGERAPRAWHQLPLATLATELETLLKGPLAANAAFVRVATEALAAARRVEAIGLGYLTLARRIRTLSGGEAQRLKLAGILAESLRGVLYVLDEPSQGLHPSEIALLLAALRRLTSLGNTVVVVDHDEAVMRGADWIIDLGPGGGARGGRVLARFKPSEAASFARTSATARYLSHVAARPTRPSLDAPKQFLTLRGAATNNLRIDAVRFARGGLTAVTGISGAGKASLVLGTLYPALLAATAGRAPATTKGPRITGHDGLEYVALIDRRPIAKSSVSMPASYLDVFGELRDLYAAQPDAQVAGLTARSFSLSVDAGRCPECKGRGVLQLKMRFLADARVECPTCGGARYQANVLAVRYLGLSIGEVLKLTLEEVVATFHTHKRIVARLTPALTLGLGYLRLGQPTASLSGGEAQRLKLAPLLAKAHGAERLLVLEEPTTGLHFEDVTKLVAALRQITAAGTTIVAIEHNDDLIQASDWVVAIGPGSAEAGGLLVYEGPPQPASEEPLPTRAPMGRVARDAVSPRA